MHAFKFIIRNFAVVLICLFCQHAVAQDCSIDSVKTHRLYISTGIGADAVSDSVVLTSGYGGNTAYPTPNNNIDTFWTVSSLSSIYNPRVTRYGFAYTGTYLVGGSHPFIIADTTNNPLIGYWAAFGPGGSCIATPSGSDRVTNWVSVYSDAGGQNGGIENIVNDGYAYDHCFYVCTEDSLRFNMMLLADDIVDSVLVDTNHLYITPDSRLSSNFYCSQVIDINKKLLMTSGRHIIRVRQRDNAGGHLGLNVYGTITSSGETTNKTIFRSKYDSKCSGNHIVSNAVPNALNSQDVVISPNPSNGNFNITLPDNMDGSLLEVYDYSMRRIVKQLLQNGANAIKLNVITGVYLLRITYREKVIVRKIVVNY